MQNISHQARPTFEIDINDKIVCYESSQPLIHGESVLLIALKTRISILALDIGTEDFTLDYRTIKDIAEPDIRLLKLCSQAIARNILFAACPSKYTIKIFSVNESEVICLNKIAAHSNYINSIDFSEEYLASGSDDHTCKIYSVKENYSEHSVLNFSASVTCVKFNPEEPNKLLISVKNGNLFIYCLKLKQSLYSFYTHSPLMHFDWSLKNPSIVAAIAYDQVFYFDISKPDVPIYSKRLSDVGKIITIHPSNPLISAVVCNRASTEIKVIHQKSTISNIFSTKIISYAGNITWNSSYLIVGSDRKICFYKIPIA
ncbi:hypothetical protein PVAND_009998 [Polypedilum vanderplanki]|uniref:Uncharacterized protein n=1 Tax=Polypedilum vanderplanki TaxID=319348 RepID=A0A9J6CFD2_POLVA|nr:hypothetical protein PVAND_009998 [Polypedilum vanderplanki]